MTDWAPKHSMGRMRGRCVGVLVSVFVLAGCPGREPTLEARTPVLEVPRLDAGKVEEDAGTGVRFAHPAATVGAITSVTVMARSSAPDDQDGEQVSSYASSFTVTVLEVDGPAPSRVKVAIERNAQTYQDRAKPTVIDGKTYELNSLTGQVSTASGAATPDEAQRVMDVVPDLGARARLEEVLPERPMRIGERRDEVATAVLRLVHPRAWTAKAAEAKLARVEGELAVFEIKLEAQSATGVNMKIAGEAHVSTKDAKLRAVHLAGGYTFKDDPPGTFVYDRQSK